MSMTAVRYPLAPAAALAADIMANLQPVCSRIETAGSIRRQEPDIGDLELICIPVPDLDLFGRPVKEWPIDRLLEQWTGQGRLLPGRCNGQKYKQFRIPRNRGQACLRLDLFLVTAETWGVQWAIRTGPAAYSKLIVTERSRGGLLEDGLQVRDGRCWQQGIPLDLPTEQAFLERAGGWLEPTERSARAAAMQPDPDVLTSRTAGVSMQPHAGRVQDRILACILERGGATCEELALALDLRHQTVSARLTELRKAERIRYEGTRPTGSGRQARIYKAC